MAIIVTIDGIHKVLELLLVTIVVVVVVVVVGNEMGLSI